MSDDDWDDDLEEAVEDGIGFLLEFESSWVVALGLAGLVIYCIYCYFN